MNEKFRGLFEKLQQEHDWPKLYLFKFIIPNENKKLALTEALFGPAAQVTINKSRNGNYLSVSAKEIMISPEEVIGKYEMAVEIEGLIAL